METAKTIFVTGATGNQGGAVARHLIQAGFRVKALVRKPASAAAQQLAGRGIELVPGDLNQPATFKAALQDADGIFSVQTFTHGIDREIQQGLSLANLAHDYQIKHFVYASVLGADLATGIPHWESKGRIEAHLHHLQLPATILRPGSFFENFQLPAIKNRLRQGKLVMPVRKPVRQHFISTEDIGRISTSIFSDPATYRGQTLNLSAEQLTMDEVAVVFAETLGRPVQYQQLPGLITRLVMGHKLHQMFKWLNQHGDALAAAVVPAPPPATSQWLTLRQWIKAYFIPA